MSTIRGRLEPSPALGLQAISSHQAGDPVPTDEVAPAPEGPVNAGAAVTAPTIPMDLGNLPGQRPVGLARCALGPVKPTVIAAAGDLEYAALNRHRPVGLMVPDEAVPHFGSLEKMATAFFKISRSIRSRSFSRCSCRSVSASVS